LIVALSPNLTALHTPDRLRSKLKLSNLSDLVLAILTILAILIILWYLHMFQKTSSFKMYRRLKEPYLATPGTYSCWQTWRVQLAD